MSEKLQALSRTITPVMFGFAVGIVAYLLFSYVPLNVLALGLALGVAGFVVSIAYQMNLEKIREERSERQ